MGLGTSVCKRRRSPEVLEVEALRAAVWELQARNNSLRSENLALTWLSQDLVDREARRQGLSCRLCGNRGHGQSSCALRNREYPTPQGENERDLQQEA